MLPASIHIKQTIVLEPELLFLLSGLLQLLVPGRGHNLQLRTSKSTLRRGPQQARQASNNTLACLTLLPSSFRCEIRAHTPQQGQTWPYLCRPHFPKAPKPALSGKSPGAEPCLPCTATGGLPCLNSSARRHSKRTKLTMRTWLQEKGPGFRERSGGAQHSSLRGAEGRARRSCHAKAALQSHRNRKRQHHALNPACRYA